MTALDIDTRKLERLLAAVLGESVRLVNAEPLGESSRQAPWRVLVFTLRRAECRGVSDGESPQVQLSRCCFLNSLLLSQYSKLMLSACRLERYVLLLSSDDRTTTAGGWMWCQRH